jgi:hypothetical protein
MLARTKAARPIETLIETCPLGATFGTNSDIALPWERWSKKGGPRRPTSVVVAVAAEVTL